LKIPFNLLLEKGEIKMKNFFNFPSFLKLSITHIFSFSPWLALAMFLSPVACYQSSHLKKTWLVPDNF
jgi:hypothetical protein